MIRNLRTLALALGAVFLLGGLMASSASATSIWFEAEEGIETVTAVEHPNIVDKFVITTATSPKTTECEEAHYESKTTTVDTTETEIEVTPVYTDCSTSGFGVATINMNGCDYRFYNPTTNASGERTANVQITCPENKQIEIHTHLFGTFKCTVTVPAQTPKGHAVFTNTGTGPTADVTAKVTLEGIHYTEDRITTSTGKEATGIGACVNGTGTDGTFNGGAIISGRTHAGEHKGVWVDK